MFSTLLRMDPRTVGGSRSRYFILDLLISLETRKGAMISQEPALCLEMYTSETFC